MGEYIHRTSEYIFASMVNFVYLFNSMKMRHPGTEIAECIKQQERTQKKFATLVWKKVSEVNELIKGKRNVTIQRDYLLHNVLGTEQRYWIDKQIRYDYQIFLKSLHHKHHPQAENLPDPSDVLPHPPEHFPDSSDSLPYSPDDLPNQPEHLPNQPEDLLEEVSEPVSQPTDDKQHGADDEQTAPWEEESTASELQNQQGSDKEPVPEKTLDEALLKEKAKIFRDF